MAKLFAHDGGADGRHDLGLVMHVLHLAHHEVCISRTDESLKGNTKSATQVRLTAYYSGLLYTTLMGLCHF